MVDFDADVRKLQQSLIIKPLAGAVLLAPADTAIPEKFTTGAAATLQALTGFKSVGHISKENSPTFTPETETSDVESWGLLEAARTDIISRNTTITWTGQETHKLNLELYHNVDLSNVKGDKDSGELGFADPTAPALRYHRAIFISVDGAGADQIYIIKVVPKFVVTEVSEQAWNQESALEYAITGRAKVDETLGYAVKTIFAGPGWKKIVTAAGFELATP
ncbi:hypothetical protein GS982_01305 [Rhodococcus hoagii]|uniref:Major tail protein n=1 Tax=Rhodococcus hoagii TaxID=43767 RepID=A0A9Q4ZIH8_RHOHA|nr:hypothetical protein [Prescottella equi]NKT77244.1 hypothetical protein [Prescottella equi]NKZ81029.1 hypothetical protein [Prescottella equi]